MSDHPLRAYRQRQGLTQAELAIRLSLSAAAVSRYEARKREPRSDELRRICDVTGISAGEIMGIEDVRTPETTQ